MGDVVDVESAIVKLIGNARRVAETTAKEIAKEPWEHECRGLLALVDELTVSLESVYDYIDELLDEETRVTLRKAHGTVHVELYLAQNNRRLHGRGRSARSALLDAQPRGGGRAR